MGWWEVGDDDAVIGDAPLDTLGDALTEIVAAYQRAFQRRPTKGEWEALLATVLGTMEAQQRPLERGVVKRVRLDVE